MGQDAAAPRAVPSSAFETQPLLRSEEVLPREWLEASHHRVQPEVEWNGPNLVFGIESDFGFFRVEGVDLTKERIREVGAIAKLQEVRKTDVFLDALKRSGASKLKTVGGVIQHPGAALRDIPKGAGRFFSRLGESVAGSRSDTENAAWEDLTGASKAKRRIAAELGVDPYTSNEVLQKELDEVSWAAAGGGLTLNLAGIALDGGVGAVVSGVNITDSLQAALVEKSPADLRMENRDRLASVAVTSALIEAFLDHPHFSPTQETLVADDIAALGRVPGNDRFFQLANTSWNEVDARFFVAVARLLRGYHVEVAPIQEIREFEGLATALDRDGALMAPIPLDLAYWTERAVERVETFRRSAASAEGVARAALWVTGDVSPRFRQELELRSIGIQARALEHLDALAAAR